MQHGALGAEGQPGGQGAEVSVAANGCVLLQACMRPPVTLGFFRLNVSPEAGNMCLTNAHKL